MPASALSHAPRAGRASPPAVAFSIFSLLILWVSGASAGSAPQWCRAGMKCAEVNGVRFVRRSNEPFLTDMLPRGFQLRTEGDLRAAITYLGAEYRVSKLSPRTCGSLPSERIYFVSVGPTQWNRRDYYPNFRVSFSGQDMKL